VLPLWEGGAAVFRVGQQRYERLKSLGEGGMGEVALARDHDIDRPVAIKRLRPEHAGTSALLRFAQEVRTIGSLEHPNIVPVHDVGVDEEGKHYFVMKYVEGETLEAIIEKLMARDPATERRFPFEVRAQVFLGVLRAVQYAHARGIIHRDIKPANIMVGPYGEVMLMDWGLARQVRGATAATLPEDHTRPPNTAASSLETQHGAVMGTPHYMSPEQARGETDRIDERSDVYSLAVMFHEMMSLRHYLDGKKSVNEVLAAVASVSDRNIVDWVADAVATGAPMEYLHYIRKGVSANPADRHANAGEMANELEDILSGRIKMQCHISATKRLGHSLMHAIDRHPLVATVFVLLGVLSALGGVVGALLAVLRLVT
jgi:eukaryotic-like serine/threonine-protein kinase